MQKQKKKKNKDIEETHLIIVETIRRDQWKIKLEMKNKTDKTKKVWDFRRPKNCGKRRHSKTNVKNVSWKED